MYMLIKDDIIHLHVGILVVNYCGWCHLFYHEFCGFQHNTDHVLALAAVSSLNFSLNDLLYAEMDVKSCPLEISANALTGEVVIKMFVCICMWNLTYVKHGFGCSFSRLHSAHTFFGVYKFCRNRKWNF